MNKKYRILAMATLSLLMFYPPGAQAATVSFPDFSDTSDLTLNGDAATTVTGDGEVLRLARTNQTFDVGSAFTNATHDITSFSTAFQFRITGSGGFADPTGQGGADGLVFVVQTISPAALGGGGGALGYTGIGSSVGVEFDTWQNNELNDPGTNHIGVVSGGNVNHGAGAPDATNVAGQFDDGEIWYAWIDYDGTTLEVRANQTGIMPAASLLSTTIDIAALVGGTEAYLGFTGATGAAYGNHDILSWEYGSGGNVIPEPATMTLMGLGLLGVALRRKKAA